MLFRSLGWGYYKKGIYDQAVVQLQRAVEIDQKDAVIREHLGDAYFKTGMNEKAIEEWENSLSIEPSNASARQKLERVKKRID